MLTGKTAAVLDPLFPRQSLARDRTHEVPGIIEFVVSPDYLDRPNLYPRQATFLKAMFLKIEEMTEYDFDVIQEWENEYVRTANKEGEGNEGTPPGLLNRIQLNRLCPCGHDKGDHTFAKRGDGRVDLKSDGLPMPGMACSERECECRYYRGRHWFREVVVPIGRRGSKGHMGAIAGAYVLWHYIAKGDPQGYYGVDRDKRLTAVVFAGKKEQAKINQWADLNNVILGAPCFDPFISRPLGESLTVRSRYDRERQRKRTPDSTSDIATFQIVPKESTPIAARGIAAFLQIYDEAAHVIKGVAKAPAEDVYECLHPDTRILYSADLTWRRMGDVAVGDRLFAYDEEPIDGKARKMRESTVLGVRRSVSQPYRVTFEDGSSVVCSDNHRWLRGWKNKDGQFNDWSWKSIKVPSRVGTSGALGNPTPLQVGDYVRWITDPWEADNSREGGYLAGVFDGEGWINTKKQRGYEVNMCQKPGEVFDTTVRYLKEMGFEAKIIEHNGTPDVWRASVTGIDDTLRFLGQIRPQRLLERHKEIWSGRVPRGDVKAKQIVSIEPEGDPTELVDIETSERTFLAEGFVSHNSATPALDQFGKDGFIYIPSSPWQRIGLFHDKYQEARELNEDGSAVYPEKMILQLPSWGLYQDWQKASDYDLVDEEHESYERLSEIMPDGAKFRQLKGAIQEYDDDMRQIERANPETFKVERRAHFAAVLDAYLNPNRIAEIWDPSLTWTDRGVLAINYRGHGDPSKSGAQFGWAIGHVDRHDDRGLPHVNFDIIHRWDPADYPDHNIDYDEIGTELEEFIDRFQPTEVTFDQFNSVSTIQRLRKYVAARRYPKRIQIYERTATGPLNWKTWETFKTALGLGLIHAPFHEWVNQELTFLQNKGDKVEPPDSGPVQTKDVADCIAIVTYELIGDELAAMLGQQLSSVKLSPSAPGGMDAYKEQRPQEHEALSAFARRKNQQRRGFERRTYGR